MPAFLEKALAASAKKKDLSEADAQRYVYGAMNNLGAMHGSKETPHGKAMEKKHNRDKARGRVR